MPDPSNYASEDAFMEACVPMMMDEGHDQDQAVAACMSMWRDKALPTADRAWSVLTVKSFDAERREIEGIASTPTVDRIGDIVEPMGAKFTLPMPLLHHHDHRAPVGHVVAAKATKDGITIKAKLVRETEPGPLKDRLDTAWQELKSGLVRGLSIGFKPLEYEALEKGGIRFLSWAWHELSLVTIPAQQDAQISLIKSLDADLLAASGNGQDGSVSDKSLDQGLSAASGTKKIEVSERTPVPIGPLATKHSINLRRTGVQSMSKTVTEQITALTEKYAANKASMEGLMAKAMEEGRSTDAEEREKFDELETENETIQGDLKRYRVLEKQMQATAKPIEPVKSAEDAGASRGGSIRVVGPKLPPGIRFARVAKCIGIARGNLGDASRVAEQLYSDDQGVVNVLKAAVSAGTTTDATWAGPLVSDEGAVFADFVEFLRPMTILGKFGTNGVPALRNVPFRVPLGSQTTGGAAYWTGEAQSKGLTRFDFSRTTLEPLKVANIAVVTEELLRSAALSAETLLRDQLAAAIRAKLDTDFIDPAVTATASIRPASITNGVTPIASSGVDTAAVLADVQAVMQGFIDADNPPTSGVWIMSASTALALSLMLNTLDQQSFPSVSMNGGTFAGLPVIVSEYVGTSGGSPNTRYVWLVNASDIWLGDDGGISVDMSREASLVMDSTPTTMHAGELGSPSAPLAAAMVSMFQTNSVAFRAERTINWALRRSTAVQGLSGVVWGT